MSGARWSLRRVGRSTERINGIRPTPAGWGFVGLLLGTTAAALVSGNNLLYMVVSGLWSLTIVSLVVGHFNLRGVSLARHLPSEFFATVDARGGFLLRNRRKRIPAFALHVAEMDGGKASGFVARVRAARSVEVPAGWSFANRGLASVGRVRISSQFPFGLAIRWVDLALGAEVLVYPRPEVARGAVELGAVGSLAGTSNTRGTLGDFVGIRPYLAGDPVRSIHWKTTARTGHAMAVQRSAEQGRTWWVHVDEAAGLAWEHALGRATRQVLDGFSRGFDVGLRLPDKRLEPASGGHWRRKLLDELGRQPWKSR